MCRQKSSLTNLYWVGMTFNVENVEQLLKKKKTFSLIHFTRVIKRELWLSDFRNLARLFHKNYTVVLIPVFKCYLKIINISKIDWPCVKLLLRKPSYENILCVFANSFLQIAFVPLKFWFFFSFLSLFNVNKLLLFHYTNHLPKIMFIKNIKFRTMGKTEFPFHLFLVLILVMTDRFKKY